MVAKEKVNLLDVVPRRSEHVITIREGEEVILSFPRFKRQWMRRFLLPKGLSPNIRVRLEEHGSAVWELIDGKRTVLEIIEMLADRFQSEPGYESRIATYLTQLQKDKFIKLMANE